MLNGLKSWVLVLALLVGGPYVLYGAVKESSDVKRLQANGRETLADVESVEWRKKHGSESGFRGHIAFKLQDGTMSHAEVSLPRALGQALKDEKVPPVVKVLYLPNQPSTVRVADMPDNSSEMRWVGGLMFAAGVGLLLWRMRGRASGPAGVTA